MKKAGKWIVGIAATPFILFALLTLLLYCPPIQRWAVGVATQYASSETGMDISIEDVRLRFPLDLTLGGVKALKQHPTLPQQRDTIFSADAVVCDIQLLPLFSSNVEIDALNLGGVKLNTTDLIAEARVKGNIKTLNLESHGIDLKNDTLLLNNALIADAKIDIQLTDSTSSDTTKTENRWKIHAQKLNIQRTDLTVHMPGDTLNINAGINNLLATESLIDLYASEYSIRNLKLSNSTARYDNRFANKVKGLDFNHLDFTGINIDIDSIYFKSPIVRLNVRNGALKEKSGLELTNASSAVSIDDKTISLKKLNISTPNSDIAADVMFDFNTFSAENPGKATADINAGIGKQDVMLFLGGMPDSFVRQWPNNQLCIRGHAEGNMQKCNLRGINIKLPTAFDANINGYVENLTDLKNLGADMKFNVKTNNISFLTSLLPKSVTSSVRIPSGIAAAGDIKLRNGSDCTAKMTITEGSGKVDVDGHIDMNRMAYEAKIAAKSFNVSHFFPAAKIGVLSCDLSAKGHGTDIFSPSTRITANGRINGFRMNGIDLAGTTMSCNLANGRCHALINGTNKAINGQLDLDALMSKKKIDATFSADIHTFDFYALNITKAPLSLGMCAHIDVTTDLNDIYRVQGSISDIAIRDSAQLYRPDDMELNINTDRTKTIAIADCGDFHLNLNAKGGYKSLASTGERVMKELNRQFAQREIDEMALRRCLPDGQLYLSVGRENPLGRNLSRFGFTCSSIFADLSSSPENSINGVIRIDSLYAGNFQIDKIESHISSDSLHTNYRTTIENGPDHPQYCFKACADGHITSTGTSLRLTLDDKDNMRGIDVSLSADVEPEGIRLRMSDLSPVLGYQKFTVNDSNFMFFSKDMRLSADVKMKADNGTAVQIYTNDENLEALQDVTISLHHFDIDKIMSVIPYTPDVKGILNGDFHTIVTTENTSVSSDIAIDNLIYEKCPMGNLASEFVYMPLEDGGHYIDGILFKDDNEIGTVKGTYHAENGGMIDATADLNDLPLNLINGFIPEQILGLQGTGDGTLNITGQLAKPLVNGDIIMKDAALVSVPYGVNLTFGKDPVRIVDSHLLFEDFKLYASNGQPMTCQGEIDFSNLENMTTNLILRAQNFQIVDAKETRRSEVYGKAFMNIIASIKGPLNALSVRGKLDLLASSDINYILRDSPLTTDNRLQELVTFTDISTQEEIDYAKPTVDGMTINMSLNINDGAHLKCWLNDSHTNYVDIYGGGNMRLGYEKEELSLTGRYTITEGEMKYSLPVIPLKTFKIAEDSYLEFTGDIMNPRLSIKATEETRSSVTDDGITRLVNFTCGIVLSKTLSDMGLEFIIDAPEDQVLHSELQMMSAEERGKLAVTMLSTGMYLTEGNTSSFTMNNALTSFLQNEINNIAGSALRTLDLTVGLENNMAEDGSVHTDYAFKFAKRFWNNRLSIAVGGKIATGNDATGMNRSFFDNVGVEYRLSETSNQYLQLFYKRAVYDFLEGYVSQYGGGYIWKKKMQSLKEMFSFGKKESVSIPVPAIRQATVPVDSTKTNNE